MKILCTGALGFIGSAYYRMFHEKHDILILDKETYAASRDNVELQGRYPAICDITDYNTVNDVVTFFKPDVVVNFAAESCVDRSITGDGVFLETNTRGVLVLLQLAKKHGLGRFLQVSTDEVYGSIIDPSGSWYEYAGVAPRNVYSASKAAAEHFAMAYHHTHGLDVVITRGANTYGPRQYPEKLIPVALQKLWDGKPIPIYGEGLQVRDWLYVADHASAIQHVLENGAAGNSYNIPGTVEMQNIEMAKRLAGVCRDSGWCVPEPYVEFVEDRKGHDFRYSMRHDKLYGLGWKHSTEIEEGLAKTVDWYGAKFRG